ncbi:unnamed protein product [Psylliodes chrysocephalus]|uniref:Uncharacterized protein n=1 Tax=Psylliodes chrysocephalus TaxID=3402493 RepID=A0A9P0CIR6_9CUCU|nr:unnamed protein product [Psylliodes chrysocephala]
MANRDLERERLIKKITEKRAKLEARGDLNIKVPRLTLPSDYNIHDRSLFSLPPELLKPILASAHPKYRRQLADDKKKAAEHKVKLQSYTALRKQREEYRSRLVKLIVATDDERDMDTDEYYTPTASEKELLRYYYYIKNGVDTVHVAPIDEKVLVRVFTLIPKKLMKFEATLAASVQDVKDDFMMAIKKAIVDFVLQDPNFINAVGEDLTKEKIELKQIGNKYRASIHSAKLKITRNLHAINPCVAGIMDIWEKEYIKLRLLNMHELKTHEGAFELNEFKYITQKQVSDCKDLLMSKYYYAVTDIFLQGNKRGQLPDPSKRKKMESFYNAVATIMTYHIQTLCLNSLSDFVEYILDVKYANKGFQIKLQQRGSVLQFEPAFKNVREVLLALIDSMIQAVMDIPRLETRLYLDWDEQDNYLKPLIAQEIVESYKEKIKYMLEDQRIGPELRVQDFDEFLPLINGQSEIYINAFLEANFVIRCSDTDITTIMLGNKHNLKNYDSNVWILTENNGWRLESNQYQFHWFGGDQLPGFVSESLQQNTASDDNEMEDDDGDEYFNVDDHDWFDDVQSSDANNDDQDD